MQVDDVVIGSGFRGLWLAAELVRRGRKTLWLPAERPQKPQRGPQFVFDDWPWGLGPMIPPQASRLMALTSDFVDTVFRPHRQDVSIQVQTSRGPIELPSPRQEAMLRLYFPKSYKLILQLLDVIMHGTEQNFMALVQPLMRLPLEHRWILEWMGALRRPVNESTASWVIQGHGDLLDPRHAFGIVEDEGDVVTARGLAWAETRGVIMKTKSRLADVEWRAGRGQSVVLDGAEGHVKFENLVLACTTRWLASNHPKFCERIGVPSLLEAAGLWIRLGFVAKPYSRPHGLEAFSSFVVDPYLPLWNENFGLLRWKSHDSHDNVTVWLRAPLQSCHREGFLKDLEERVWQSLNRLYPQFEDRVLSRIAPEPLVTGDGLRSLRDDAAVIWNHTPPAHFECALKNVFWCGPEWDRGLELMSALATEFRVVDLIWDSLKKEKRIDSTLHATGHGEDMVGSKSI